MREPPTPADDDAWLDALAGRPAHADTGDAASVAEGLLLRDALRRWPAEEPAPDAVADQVRLTALLAAAHADHRLAARRGCVACEAIARWLSGRRWAGATVLVAAAVTAAVLVPWRASVTPPPVPVEADILRGPGSEGVQRLQAADPRGLRDRIVRELAQAGVPATRYERLGRYGLDAELPLVRSGELLQLLSRHGIAAPTHGGLAVEFEAGP